jgi:CO/xanthine dehydrogenase FAD-binding subunit
MKSPPFAYHAPPSIDEAVDLLADLGEDAKVLSGGQSLVPLLALRLATPTALVDINRIAGLDGIVAGADGLRIGGLVRHADAEHSALVAEYCPLLAEALPYVGHQAIRNRGTIVGSIAHGDPAAELPAIAVATDAVASARSVRGIRTIAAQDFFLGFLTTALEPDEVLVEVRVPRLPSRSGTAWLEVSRRHGDFAMVGAACIVTLDASGRVEDVRIALSGVDGTPVRATEAESLLHGVEPGAEVFAGAAAVAGRLARTADLHGTVEYRARLVSSVVRRGLAAATERARGSA